MLRRWLKETIHARRRLQRRKGRCFVVPICRSARSRTGPRARRPGVHRSTRIRSLTTASRKSLELGSIQVAWRGRVTVANSEDYTHSRAGELNRRKEREEEYGKMGEGRESVCLNSPKASRGSKEMGYSMPATRTKSRFKYSAREPRVNAFASARVATCHPFEDSHTNGLISSHLRLRGHRRSLERS